MRIKTLLASLAFSALILSACDNKGTETPKSANSSASTKPVAMKADPKVVDEVRDLLVKHDKALNDKSLDGVMATYSAEPQTVLLGTGDGERFVGPAAIKEAYTEIFKDYDKGTLDTNCDWKTGGVDESGLMAWFGATCKAKDSMKSVNRNYVLNVSGTALKQDSGWHFVMLHMSNSPDGPPTPPTKTVKKDAD
jgi:ketosteroid isomerase-like protein